MDKALEMRSKIEAVFEHYSEQSEYYRGANVAQRFVMKDRSTGSQWSCSARSLGRLKAWSRKRIKSRLHDRRTEARHPVFFCNYPGSTQARGDRRQAVSRTRDVHILA